MLRFLKEISICNYYEPDIAYRGVFGSPLRGFASLRGKKQTNIKEVGKAFDSPDFINI